MDFKPLASTVWTAVTKHLLPVLAVLALLSGFFYHRHEVSKLQAVAMDLQNQMAAKDKTIEDQKGLYEKLTLQAKNVQDALSSKDVQIAELKSQLDKAGEQLSDATSVALKWKQAYQGAAAATQSQPNPSRIRVDFNHDFGYVGITGYTLTNPAEAFVDITNNRPVKLTVALSQDKNRAWHSYVTSSEDNIQADIQVSVVDPTFRDEHWYEHIGFMGNLGFGTTDAGVGGLAGVGAMYEFNNLEVGPAVWLAASNRLDHYFGASVVWKPWKRF